MKEKFAKRKVIIMLGRSNQKLVWYKEDSGTKYFIGEYSKNLSDDLIYADVRNQYTRIQMDGDNDNESHD